MNLGLPSSQDKRQLEFPEFLSVFFSNFLKSFTKPKIWMLRRGFLVERKIPELNILHEAESLVY